MRKDIDRKILLSNSAIILMTHLFYGQLTQEKFWTLGALFTHAGLLSDQTETWDP